MSTANLDLFPAPVALTVAQRLERVKQHLAEIESLYLSVSYGAGVLADPAIADCYLVMLNRLVTVKDRLRSEAEAELIELVSAA